MHFDMHFENSSPEKAKKIPVFRVTYLNLLVKPRIFFRFSKINLCILKGEMPFKMHKINFFSRKKN